MKKTLLLLVLTIALNAKAQDTDNLFTIVTKYSSEFGGSTRMGNVNPTVGFVNNIGTATSPNLFSIDLYLSFMDKQLSITNEYHCFLFKSI